MEISASTNDLQLRDLGITNDKIADATVANTKLVHPDITVNTARGLLGGQQIFLGGSGTVQPDFTVVPDLAATNTFAAGNTFQGAVHITNATASASQSSGALVVDGGVGIVGDLYVASTYNMSDRTLKQDILTISNAMDVVERMNGCFFTWTDCEANREACRVGIPTVGVIAQEVRDAGAPLCVATHPDTHLLAVDYNKLVPYLIESCKMLGSEVRALKRRCDVLEEASSGVVPTTQTAVKEVPATRAPKRRRATEQ